MRKKVGELLHMPGTVGEALTWAVEFPEPSAVIVLVQDHEGRWLTTWSKMQMRDLTLAERCFKLRVDCALLRGA